MTKVNFMDNNLFTSIYILLIYLNITYYKFNNVEHS